MPKPRTTFCFLLCDVMAPLWFYVSILTIISMATIASPVSHIDRSKRSEDDGTSPILVPPTNVSLYSSASQLKTTTLRFQSNIATGTDFTGETVQTELYNDQQTPKQLTREERSTRSRSRTRSSGTRSSKRTSTSTSNRGSSRHSISSGDVISTPSRRTSGSHKCRTGMCDEGRPTLVRVVRSMRRQLYRLLSRILGEEFTPPETLSENTILTLLNFLGQHGGDDGQNFLNRVGTTHTAMVTLWERCCQTYSLGRRKRSTSLKLDEPVDLSELAITLIVYSIQR